MVYSFSQLLLYNQLITQKKDTQADWKVGVDYNSTKLRLKANTNVLNGWNLESYLMYMPCTPFLLGANFNWDVTKGKFSKYDAGFVTEPVANLLIGVKHDSDKV